MPHISRRVTIGATAVVYPITGNAEHGSAAYDPSTGEALYAVYNPTTDAFEMYRTRAGYKTLTTEDDSVDYLATIATDARHEPRNIGLTRIDGVLYALIAAVFPNSDEAGTFVYVDGSTDLDGSGPWTRHSTVVSVTPSSDIAGPEVGTYLYPAARWAGEIAVLGSRWAVSAHETYIATVGFDQRMLQRPAIYTSDGGRWSLRHRPTFGLGHMPGVATTSWAKWSGSWYWQMEKETSATEEQRYSTDGTTWTSYLSASVTGDTQPLTVFSSPDRIFQVTLGNVVQSATAAPETDPAWTTVVNLGALGFGSSTDGASPHFCQIGPAWAPLVIATELGQVSAIAEAKVGAYVGFIGYGLP